MYFQHLPIVFKTQGRHRIQYVLPAYCFPLLHLALLRRLARDKGDKFRDTLLYAFFSVFRDFGRGRHGGFHYT